jgi:hypothetical protein
VLRKRRPGLADALVAVCRIAVAGGLLFSFFHGFAVSAQGFLLSFGWGLLWALAAPFSDEGETRPQTRAILVSLALFQVLHAYPVAGTQVSLGTALLAVLVILALADLAAWGLRRGWLRAVKVASGLAALFPVWGISAVTSTAGLNYWRAPHEPLAQTRLKLSQRQLSTLSHIATNARFHGDTLFSLPGMFSFNLWTELPTPTSANITQWWSLLDERQQTAIQRTLEQTERPVVIIQRNLITSGLAAHVYRETELTRFIASRFRAYFKSG